MAKEIKFSRTEKNLAINPITGSPLHEKSSAKFEPATRSRYAEMHANNTNALNR